MFNMRQFQVHHSCTKLLVHEIPRDSGVIIKTVCRTWLFLLPQVFLAESLGLLTPLSGGHVTDSKKLGKKMITNDYLGDLLYCNHPFNLLRKILIQPSMQVVTHSNTRFKIDMITHISNLHSQWKMNNIEIYIVQLKSFQ